MFCIIKELIVSEEEQYGADVCLNEGCYRNVTVWFMAGCCWQVNIWVLDSGAGLCSFCTVCDADGNVCFAFDSLAPRLT